MEQRLAVIADIHGNVDALRVVLDDIAQQGADKVVNLGDCLSGPLAARETADLLMAADILTIRGNHDRWLVEKPVERMGPSDRTAYEALDRVHLDWLAGLPATARIWGDVFLCHGTPGSDLTYWLEQVLADGSVGLRQLDGISAEANGVAASLILCGHTHLPRMITLPGGPMIVNPGSVGCPAYTDDQPVPHVMQSGTPCASYALIDRTQRRWSVSFRLVPYDTSRMAGLARKAGREDWAKAIETGWLG